MLLHNIHPDGIISQKEDIVKKNLAISLGDWRTSERSGL